MLCICKSCLRSVPHGAEKCPYCSGDTDLATLCKSCGGIMPLSEAHTICAHCKADVMRSFAAFIGTLDPYKLDYLNEKTDGTYLEDAVRCD